MADSADIEQKIKYKQMEEETKNRQSSDQLVKKQALEEFFGKNEGIYKHIKKGEGPVTGLEPLVDKGVIEAGSVKNIEHNYKFKK